MYVCVAEVKSENHVVAQRLIVAKKWAASKALTAVPHAPLGIAKGRRYTFIITHFCLLHLAYNALAPAFYFLSFWNSLFFFFFVSFFYVYRFGPMHIKYNSFVVFYA